MLNRNRLKNLDNLREERIDDLGNDQPKNPLRPDTNALAWVFG